MIARLYHAEMCYASVVLTFRLHFRISLNTNLFFHQLGLQPQTATATATATPMEMEMHKKHVQCTRPYQRIRARARWKNAKICKTTKNQKKIKLKPQGEPERKNTLLLGGGERKKKKRTLLTDLLLSSLHINRNVQPCWDRLSRLHRLPFLRGNKRRGRRSGFLPTFAGTTL